MRAERFFRTVGILLAVVGLLYVLFSPRSVFSLHTTGRFVLKEYVRQMADRTGLPWAYVNALIESESGWNPDVTGSKNVNGTIDHGLGQLNDKTLKEFGLTKQDAYNPKVNAAFTIQKILSCRERAAVEMQRSKIKPTKRNYYYLTTKCYKGPKGDATSVLARVENELLEDM